MEHGRFAVGHWFILFKIYLSELRFRRFGILILWVFVLDIVSAVVGTVILDARNNPKDGEEAFIDLSCLDCSDQRSVQLVPHVAQGLVGSEAPVRRLQCADEYLFDWLQRRSYGRKRSAK